MKTAPAGTLTSDEELQWIALRMIPGLGSRKSVQLVQTFRTPGEVFRASRADLEAAGLSGSIAQSISSGCTFEEAVDQQKRAHDSGVQVVPISDPRYPARLREIFDPPLLLFARGRVELLETVMLGVVGTRRPSAYGIAAAERLSSELSAAQLTIVSGLARGIDTASHRAALGSGGNTVAVLGCGADVIYPTENRKLTGEVAARGLIVSEFPMAAPPFPQNFPIRNRIISGMSAGVMIVEGAQYSGSAITARLAMEQNREVFAVPGNITSRLSWAPNLLIKQGAKLVQEWNDVVVELQPEDRRRLVVEGQRSLEALDSGDSQPVEKSLSENPQTIVGKELLSRLQTDTPTQLDHLLETLEYHSSSELIAALFELEMLGLVRQLPGKNFVKVW